MQICSAVSVALTAYSNQSSRILFQNLQICNMDLPHKINSVIITESSTLIRIAQSVYRGCKSNTITADELGCTFIMLGSNQHATFPQYAF